jgi:hypothetical protein
MSDTATDALCALDTSPLVSIYITVALVPNRNLLPLALPFPDASDRSIHIAMRPALYRTFFEGCRGSVSPGVTPLPG